jgi:hypothetical protein
MIDVDAIDLWRRCVSSRAIWAISSSTSALVYTHVHYGQYEYKVWYISIPDEFVLGSIHQH